MLDSAPHRHSDAPAYSAVPTTNEQRIFLRTPSPPPSTDPANTVSKRSKSGSLLLHIYGQLPGSDLPVFARGQHIRGAVQISKCDNVASVDLRLDGFLRLEEIGEAGKLSVTILAQQLNLWSKAGTFDVCPPTLDIDFHLAQTYHTDDESYPLPPSYQVQLIGVPGFHAQVHYELTVRVTKMKESMFGNHTVVSTPVIYRPRLKASRPLPSLPQIAHAPHAALSPDWEVIEASMRARSENTKPILTKLYIPAGRSYCFTSAIPFRFKIESSALSLASFLPCSPTAPERKSSHEKRGSTKIQVIRQVAVDVRNMQFAGSTKTDIFKATVIGEATFRFSGDGPDWVAWDGEIILDEGQIDVGSFKAGGLWVRDSIVLTIVPPGVHSSPLLDLRHAVPIRLVTDPHSSEVGTVSSDWPVDDKSAMAY